MWYRFVARGRETLYGWTTKPDVAQAAEDSLREEDRRAGREFDFYGFECLGESGIDEETAELCARMEREQWQTLLIDDDTTVEDIEAMAEERRRDREAAREAAERKAHLHWGFDIWRMWLARMVDGCSPAALAAALECAIDMGYCQPGDPTGPVAGEAKDASLQVRARSLYLRLLTLRPEDREEGLAIARAIVATPASWQRLESRDLTVRDCIYAARAEADADAVEVA